MEQFKSMTPEEFKNLSNEEKREFVRKLIHSEAAEIHAAFYNPQTKETVDIKGLVEQLGEEKTLDLVMKAFEADSDVKARSITGAEIKDLIMKAERGECTEEELEFLDFITSQLSQNDEHLKFQHQWLEITADLLNFTQKRDYNPEIADLLACVYMFFSTSGMVAKDGALSKYNYTDVPIITEMCGQIAEDIYNTWKASCTSLPDPSLIILGLLQLALDIAHKNNIVLSNAKDIANGLGLNLISEEDDEEDNGSNAQPKVYKPATYNPSSDNDEEMRDLLKE